jgi:hypothetical protein
MILFVVSNYVRSSRPSISSMASVDSYHSINQPLTPIKLQDSISNDDSASVASDSASLTSSLPTFNAVGDDLPDDNDDDEAVAQISIITTPSSDQTKKSRPSLFKTKTISTVNPFDTFDTDLTRALRCLENSLSKQALESKGTDTFISSIDSQLADIRLMIGCEKDCSLLENQGRYPTRYANDRGFKSVLNEFDMRVMQILFDQYLKAGVILGIEAAKNK